MTYLNNFPRSAPCWVARNATDAPPLRYEPFFRFLEPLNNRFLAYTKHRGDNAPNAEWWPNLRRLIDRAGGQFAEPLKREPFAIFARPHLRDEITEPQESWNEWVKNP